MNIDQKGIEFIQTWENLSLQPYKDSGGLYTVGFGHLIVQPKDNWMMKGITEVQAQQIFNQDLQPPQILINLHVIKPLTQNQFSALVSFVFNVGRTNFLQSTMLKLLNQGNYTGASNEFLKWVFVSHREVAGLLNRRKAEQALFNER